MCARASLPLSPQEPPPVSVSVASPVNSQQIQQVAQAEQAAPAAPTAPAAAVAPAVTASDAWEAPVTLAPPVDLPSQGGVPILSGNNSASLWGAGAVRDGANPMPAEELSRPPMFRHLDYFDRNKDGTITIPEMYQGLRDMGASRATAAKL